MVSEAHVPNPYNFIWFRSLRATKHRKSYGFWDAHPKTIWLDMDARLKLPRRKPTICLPLRHGYASFAPDMRHQCFLNPLRQCMRPLRQVCATSVLFLCLAPRVCAVCTGYAPPVFLPHHIQYRVWLQVRLLCGGLGGCPCVFHVIFVWCDFVVCGFYLIFLYIYIYTYIYLYI